MTYPFYTPGPPASGGGFSGSGMGGFSNYLNDKGYSNEKDLLSVLPNLDLFQQIKLDMALHQDAIDSGTFHLHNNLLYNDGKWKEKLIDVFKGKNSDPDLIKSLIQIIKRDIMSHQNRIANRVTGSDRWHQTWIEVYKQWLKKLTEKM